MNFSAILKPLADGCDYHHKSVLIHPAWLITKTYLEIWMRIDLTLPTYAVFIPHIAPGFTISIPEVYDHAGICIPVHLGDE